MILGFHYYKHVFWLLKLMLKIGDIAHLKTSNLQGKLSDRSSRDSHTRLLLSVFITELNHPRKVTETDFFEFCIDI